MIGAAAVREPALNEGSSDLVPRRARRRSRAQFDIALRDADAPLPHQRALEARFGQDLSSIPVRRGAGAQEALAGTGAAAAAVGGTVVLPDAHAREDVVAHEVAHALDQQQRAVPGVELWGSAAERTAERVARAPAGEAARGGAGGSPREVAFLDARSWWPPRTTDPRAPALDRWTWSQGGMAAFSAYAPNGASANELGARPGAPSGETTSRAQGLGAPGASSLDAEHRETSQEEEEAGADAAFAIDTGLASQETGGDGATESGPGADTGTASGEAASGDASVAEPPRAPAVVPEALSPPPGTIGAEPDGFVDYYMEANWDSAAFHELASQVGYPDGPSSVSKVDELLPPDISPEARAAINVACALGAGLVDEWAIERAAEMIGLSSEFLSGVLGLGAEALKFDALEDPLGLTILLGCTALGQTFDLLEGFSDELQERVVMVQAGLDAVMLLGMSVGQIVSVATYIFGPQVGAAVQLAITTIAGTAKGLAVLLETIRLPIAAFAAAVETLQTLLVTIQYLYADFQASEAEANGDFARAAEYRDIARGHVVALYVAWLSTVKDVVLVIPVLGSYGTMAAKLLGRGRASVSAGLGYRVGRLSTGGAAGVGDHVQSLIDELAAGTDWWHERDTLLPGQQADAMKAGPYVSSRALDDATSAVGSELAPSRQQTTDWLFDTQTALLHDDPSWYQELINEIHAPPGMSFEDAGSATYWFVELLDQVPFLWSYVREGSLLGFAAGCDAAAVALPMGQPFADDLAMILARVEPDVDQMIVELNALLQRQDVQMERLEAMVASLDQGIADAEGLLAPSGVVAESFDALFQLFGAMRIDTSQLGIPAVVPPSMIEDAVAPFNAAVDGAVLSVTAARDQSLRALQDTIGVVLAGLRAKLAMVQAAIVEGGTFRVALEAEIASLKAGAADVAAALVAWDASVPLDLEAGAAWLQAIAAAARQASVTAEEPDPWPEILETIAQPAVNGWRGRHDADVEAQFRPVVPPWEVQAVARLYYRLMARTDLTASDKREIHEAFVACLDYRGKQGREALSGFWDAEAVFVEVTVEALAGRAP